MGREHDFRKVLGDLLNSHSMEEGSNTPDFILARFLTGCLKSFDEAVSGRDVWYHGHVMEPAQLPAETESFRITEPETVITRVRENDITEEEAWKIRTLSRNAEGNFVPDIPLPVFSFFFVKTCPNCQMNYLTRAGYRGHYALVHILRLSSGE